MIVTVNGDELYVIVLTESLAAKFAFPAASVTPKAARRGRTVPLVNPAAATVNVVASPESVIVQVIPVEVPKLLISAAVSDATLIASENVNVKLIGVEFVEVSCPDFLSKDTIVGAALSWV